MTNLTGLKHVAAKKRREYLRKRVTVIGTFTAGTMIVAMSGAVFAGLTVLLVVLMICYCSPFHWLPWWWQGIRITSILVAVSLPCIASFGLWLTLVSEKRLRTLPYVPPVAEQLAALPDHKVLLRGSDQQSAVPDELLRAARQVTAISSMELLRAKQGALDEEPERPLRMP